MSLIFSLLSDGQALNPTDTPTFNGLKTTLNVGTVATGSSVVEYGDGYNHTSVITVNTTLPAITGGVAQGLGKLIYTFPAGAVIASLSYISIGITQTQGNINADTPDVGLGTTIASGAISLLDGTATFENIMSGQLATNCTGTETKNNTINHTDINAADDHTVYLNVADTWAAGGDTGALLTGTIILNWQFFA